MDSPLSKSIRSLLRSAARRKQTRLSLSLGQLLVRVFGEIYPSDDEVTFDIDWAGLGVEEARVLADAAPTLGAVTSLDLEGNQLRAEGVKVLADALVHLPNLKELNLAGNKIADAGIKALTNASSALRSLRVLDLRSNEITSLDGEAFSDAVSQWKSLRRLRLGNNDLGVRGSRVIAQSLTRLRQLEVLDLAENEICNDGAFALSEVVPELDSLTHLDVRGNGIGLDGTSRLISSLMQANNLEFLDLGNNRIGMKGIQQLVGAANKLANLKVLGLATCGLRSVEVWSLLDAVQQPPWQWCLQTLILTGNEIEGIPEELIRNRNAAAWREYARQIQCEGEQRLLEIKLLLLGEGRNGKSHLRRRLFEGTPYFHSSSETPTHDIDFVRWRKNVSIDGQLSDVAVRVWDFGGQRHLHASHRFFLSDKRGLFLIVCDAMRTRDENRLDYWLRLVRNEACADGPVVVAVTKCDLCDDKAMIRRERRLEHLDAEELRVAGGFSPSAELTVVEGIGWSSQLEDDPRRNEVWARHVKSLSALESAIVNSIQYVPDMCTKYSPSLLNAVRWFETDAFNGASDSDRPYVKLLRFRRACVAELNLPKGLQETALAIANNIGLIHYVGDRDDIRSGDELAVLIFNPAWVKTPVYTVIWNDGCSHNGVLSWKSIETLLPQHDRKAGATTLWERRKFTARERGLVIDLMAACELVFELRQRGSERQYLVPDHLKYLSSSEFRADGRMWERSFEWLPEADFGMLIGRLCQHYGQQRCELWRDAIRLSAERGVEVFVRHVPARAHADQGPCSSTVRVAVRGGTEASASRYLDGVATRLAEIVKDSTVESEAWKPLVKPRLVMSPLVRRMRDDALRREIEQILVGSPDGLSAREIWEQLVARALISDEDHSNLRKKMSGKWGPIFKIVGKSSDRRFVLKDSVRGNRSS